ncbi:hypothetical protein IGI39_001474 [Enterococcus sp. AZ135]
MFSYESILIQSIMGTPFLSEKTRSINGYLSLVKKLLLLLVNFLTCKKVFTKLRKCLTMFLKTYS